MSHDGSDIVDLAFYAYDATIALAIGLHKAYYEKQFKNMTGDDLLWTIMDEVDFHGVTGDISFYKGANGFDAFGRGDRTTGIDYQILNFAPRSYHALVNNGEKAWMSEGIWSAENKFEICDMRRDETAIGLHKAYYEKQFKNMTGDDLLWTILNEVDFHGVTGDISFNKGAIGFDAFARGDRTTGIDYQILNFAPRSYHALVNNGEKAWMSEGIWTADNEFLKCDMKRDVKCSEWVFNTADNSEPIDEAPILEVQMDEASRVGLRVGGTIALALVLFFLLVVELCKDTRLIKAALPNLDFAPRSYHALVNNGEKAWMSEGIWTADNEFLKCDMKRDVKCSEWVFNTADNSEPIDEAPILEVQMDEASRVGLRVGGTIALVLVLFFYLVVELCKDTRLIKAAQPLMMKVALIGAMMASIRVLLVTVDLNDVNCVVGKWLGHLAFALAFGALIIKIWRVDAVVNSGFRKVKITMQQVQYILLGGLIVFCIYLAVDTIYSRPHLAYEEYFDGHNTVRLMKCTNDRQDMTIALFTFEALLIAFGARLCWNTKDAPGAVNDARFIAMAMYLILFVCSVTFPIVYLNIHPSPSNLLTIMAIAFIITTIGCAMLLFGPKTMLLWRGADVNDKFEVIDTELDGAQRTNGLIALKQKIKESVGSSGGKSSTKHSEAQQGAKITSLRKEATSPIKQEVIGSVKETVMSPPLYSPMNNTNSLKDEVNTTSSLRHRKPFKERSHLDTCSEIIRPDEKNDSEESFLNEKGDNNLEIKSNSTVEPFHQASGKFIHH
eukprot:CAMPEP_0182439180 /NCGR_PEP_ID=MMETSP1167-20130531/86280_1 /TAXON_ID=2988 /ORGANISM="Mallomonas Sp, Strain CCMP3275" /LENGTH=781 /DNA_ID=CAMNT_0024632823 /DNA_START=33 /DNA_END=2383 /DNA_ORIENTATION=-